MIVDQNHPQAHNGKPPVLEALAACNCEPGKGVVKLLVRANPALAAPAPNGKERLMSHRHYVRSRPEGRHHRTKLRVLVLPTLRLGQPVPTGTFLGHWLGINESEAWRHFRRVLAEDGYGTETRGFGRARRVYVVEIPALKEVAA